MKTKQFKMVLPSKSFIERMDHFGLLKPGQVISKEEIESILDAKYIGPEDWNFLGKYLALKTSIEAAGFFITSAGLTPPEFRIVPTEEMAEHAERRMAKAVGSIFKTGMVMANHDTTGLDEREKKIFNSTKQKAAMAALATQKIVLGDLSFD